jgi:hypothetical protein
MKKRMMTTLAALALAAFGIAASAAFRTETVAAGREQPAASASAETEPQAPLVGMCLSSVQCQRSMAQCP